MKVVGSCMWLCSVGVVFVLLSCCSSQVNRSLLVSGDTIADSSTTMTGPTTNSRQLEEKAGCSIGTEHCDDAVSLEDYRPYDPSPSSKASVRPGPIEHGTPLMPYIPSPRAKPSPPTDSDLDYKSPGPSISD